MIEKDFISLLTKSRNIANKNACWLKYEIITKYTMLICQITPMTVTSRLKN